MKNPKTEVTQNRAPEGMESQLNLSGDEELVIEELKVGGLTVSVKSKTIKKVGGLKSEL